MFEPRAAAAPVVESFLAWASGRGEPVPERPAEVFTTLALLRGAVVKSGALVVTAGLIAQLFTDDLPLMVDVADEEQAEYAAVARLMIDRQHELRLLNGKRRAKLLDALHDAMPGFTALTGGDELLSWARHYAALMRADGVDRSDSRAVVHWLEGFSNQPTGWPKWQEPEGIPGWALLDTMSPLLCEHMAAAGEAARATAGALVLERSVQWYEEQLERAEQPVIHNVNEISGQAERAAGELLDAWTAAGLGAALAGPYRKLADGAVPGATRGMLSDFTETVDEVFRPGGNRRFLPVTLPDDAAVQDLVRNSPLLAAAARWSADPRGELPVDGAALDLVIAVAEATGMAADGAVAWNTGEPATLVRIALDALAHLTQGQPELWEQAKGPQDDESEEEDDEESVEMLEYLDSDHVLLLLELYDQIGPMSVAGQTAVSLMWSVDARSPLPPAEPTAVTEADLTGLVRAPERWTGRDAAYTLPGDGALAASGVRIGGREDRDELEEAAYWYVLLLDRFRALGVVARDGDRLSVTPLGRVLVYTGLVHAGVGADRTEDLPAWDAAVLVDALPDWDRPTARAVLEGWLAVRTEAVDGWREVLTAAGAAGHGRRHLLSVLGVSADGLGPLLAMEEPDAADPFLVALSDVVADPVVGAYAARTLLHLGQRPPDEPPRSAQAVVRLDKLFEALRADHLAILRADTAHRPGSTLLAAFEEAAAGWPGSARDLLEALADQGRGAHDVLRVLGAVLPDADLAEAARRLARRAAGGPVPPQGKNRKRRRKP